MIQISVHAYFAEVEAVCSILDEFMAGIVTEDLLGEEVTAAVWQAGELLARAYQVLMPLVQLDLAKQALVLPDSYEKPSGLILPDSTLPGL